MRRTLLELGCWVLGATALVTFAGCGGSGQATKPSAGASAAAGSFEVTREAWISLDALKGAQSVGVLMAQKLGYFEDQGVEMRLTSAASPDGALGYLAEGSVDFGITGQPQVVLAREEGAPVVAVGALETHPTAALIWLRRSGIHTIGDLRGRTIATPGQASQDDFLESLLKRHGLGRDDVRIKHVGYELARALADGKADAIFGGSWNVEGEILADRGLRPVVRRGRSLGFPAYDEQVMVARADQVAKDGSLVRNVLAAVHRGVAAAIAHPRAAVKAIKASDETDLYATPKETEAEVNATLPLLSRTGYMSPGRAEDLVDWMHGEGLIQRKVPASQLLTNRFLSR